MRIGIFYICIGAYDFFWKDFYLSAERFLFQDSSWTREYYVFTDHPSIYGEEENKRIHRIEQADLGWPDNTMKRFDMLLRIKERVRKETDYLYFFNANMEFLMPVGTDILPKAGGHDLVGVPHTFWVSIENKWNFRYERRLRSASYIPFYKGRQYFQGSLWGGTTKATIKLCEVCSCMVEADRKRGIIPRWQDESVINRYFIDNPPTELSIYYNYTMRNKGRYREVGLTGEPVILQRDKTSYFSWQGLGRPSYEKTEAVMPLPCRMYVSVMNHLMLVVRKVCKVCCCQ
ncbi:family 6 glucosyltransferase [Parabacteroides bouchesdurhonensis]|uniref:family 6 glucosyltransferase n=1 Tax=Parabacteroides bouchesdurhonensis TaxID=1936995 RepID=UPI000E55659D|nr:family 6 glucosyltransferase [Parabacteroides bouchesdurhonensis]RHJ94916.1 glycosyl transferase family 6 [Bacteroides sp. AM07-16]